MKMHEDVIFWAWKKREEGHGVKQIADSIGVTYKTLERAFNKVYGTCKPLKFLRLVREKPQKWVPLNIAKDEICNLCTYFNAGAKCKQDECEYMKIMDAYSKRMEASYRG